MITFSDNLLSDTVGCASASNIMVLHVNATTGGWRKCFQQLQVDLRIMSMHESKGNHGSAAQMLSDKGVHSISILKSVKQRRQTFGLVVQREHCLMHQSKGALAHLSQHSSLGDPVLKKCHLHRFRPICPEVVGNQIGMCLSSEKVRIHTSGFSSTIEAHIYKNR
jgi:hypothetical protein